MFKQLIAKFKTKERQRGVFTDSDRAKSELVRAQQGYKAEFYKLQKMQVDAQREEIEEMSMQTEIQLNKEKLQRMRENLYGNDDEDDEDDENVLSAMGLPSEEMQLVNGITNILSKLNGNNQTPIASSNPTVSTSSVVSDEVLQKWIAQIPKPMLNKLKKEPDEQIMKEAKEKYPDLSEDSITRMIKLVKA